MRNNIDIDHSCKYYKMNNYPLFETSSTSHLCSKFRNKFKNIYSCEECEIFNKRIIVNKEIIF